MIQVELATAIGRVAQTGTALDVVDPNDPITILAPLVAVHRPAPRRGRERVVPAGGEYIVLRAPGNLDDYPGNSLSGIQTAIVGDISGLKAHPNGWQVVEER